jgi:hypothetical protein
MGIRKSAQTERRGVSGMGKPFGSPNNRNVRSARRHIPLYVRICVQPYSGQLQWIAACKSALRPERKWKIETARVRGIPAIPRRSPRTPPPPRSPPVVVNIRLGRWRNLAG